jgi:flavin reductase (DIM6/NTAB) family NADH-FMN oxidoreductase RutF
MPLSKYPLEVALAISTTHYTARIITDSRELTMNIPYSAQLDLVMQCGTTHGDDVNKFKKFNIPIGNTKTSKAPYITSCAAYLAGKLMDSRLAMEHEIFKIKITEAYVEDDLFDGRWLIDTNPRARFLHHLGDGKFAIDGEYIDTKK